MSTIDKVIIALDHENPVHARLLVDEIGELIEWYKIGPALYMNEGTEMISFLRSRKKRIFLDLKLFDIPAVVESTVRQMAGLGVELATVHCLGGQKMLEKASVACRNSKLELLGVTLLTSFEDSDSEAFGWSRENHIDSRSQTTLIQKMVSMALRARLRGIVCSPSDLKAVRPMIPVGFSLVTPGIRPKGTDIFEDDQVRIATPNEAVEWGADYIVLGRPVTCAREPRQVIESLLN